MITGCKLSEEYHTEMAYLIPYTLMSHPDCQNLHFWKILKMFCSPESTNIWFAEVHSTINGFDNLISLNSCRWSKFITGSLILTPMAHENYPIVHSLNRYTEDYWLAIDYCSRSDEPELIEFTIILNTGMVRTLWAKSKIPIAYHEWTPGISSIFQQSSYFALHFSVLLLKCMCEHTTAWFEVLRPLTPCPVSSIDIRDALSADVVISKYSAYAGADPVCATSAILQHKVDSGVLGRSP